MINTQKSTGFLNTSNEVSTKIIKKTIPFVRAYKRITYLGMNLSKDVKDVYTEKNKTLLKEIKNIKKKKKKLKTALVHGLRNLILSQCQSHPV